MSREEEKEVSMERNITLSPEALPYWNMIKDASPKVIDELGYYINTIHLYRKIKNRPKRDFDEFCGIWASDSEVSADELTKEVRDSGKGKTTEELLKIWER